MNIYSSTAIRQNYNEIAKIYSKIGENALECEAYNRQNKMLELREELFAVEKDRLTGRTGCTLDELESYLDDVISES